MKEACGECNGNVQEVPLTRRKRLAEILSRAEYPTPEWRESVVNSLDKSDIPDNRVFELAEMVTSDYQKNAEQITKEKQAKRIRESGIF